jgi:hypothetical protein
MLEVQHVQVNQAERHIRVITLDLAAKRASQRESVAEFGILLTVRECVKVGLISLGAEEHGHTAASCGSFHKRLGNRYSSAGIKFLHVAVTERPPLRGRTAGLAIFGLLAVVEQLNRWSQTREVEKSIARTGWQLRWDDAGKLAR